MSKNNYTAKELADEERVAKYRNLLYPIDQRLKNRLDKFEMEFL